jgi:Holliday junction resolvase RusA-like endonuclease
MTSFGFRVYGTPSPQGSKIPGVNRKTGKMFVREQSGERLKTWREAVKEAALMARGDSDTIPKGIAVRIHIDFYMPRPASIPFEKRPMPSVAPDLDKMIRGVGDALRDAGIYADDSQVCSIVAHKHYASEKIELSAGAWIVVQAIPNDPRLS